MSFETYSGGLSEPAAVQWNETPDGCPFYSFPLLDRSGLVSCGFSTRLGGVSPAPFDSLNLGTTTKDDPENVRANRARFGEALGGMPVLEWINLVHGRAVHEASTLEATFRCTPQTPEADAVITDRRELPLVIYTADCVPIVFVDPRTPAVGLAHAGWRGTVADIAGATVTAMKTRYGTDPAHLLCGLGASIGPCCFEVHDDVAGPVRAGYPQWQDSVVSLINAQKHSIDLWQLNALQLERVGVPRRNIAISRLCTACRADLFFSYRRDRRETGRLSMLVALR